MKPRTMDELDSMVRAKQQSVSVYRSLVRNNVSKIVGQQAASDKEFSKFSDWDNFDRINFMEWNDDSGEPTGVEIGGH